MYPAHALTPLSQPVTITPPVDPLKVAPKPTTAAPAAFWCCRGEGSFGCEDFTQGVAAPTPSIRGSLGVVALDTIERIPDASSYEGELITDILEYRRLRARSLAGDRLSTNNLERYAELRAVLCAMEPSTFRHGRSYNRFTLRMPAKVRFDRHGTTEFLDITLENICAGGVKVAGATGPAEGDAVELLLAANRFRTVVIPARIAWLRRDQMGLTFAGSARWY